MVVKNLLQVIEGDSKILSELGNKKRIEILRFISEKGWSNSTKIARSVGIHVAIVSKFLETCSEYGILERRLVRGRKRSYYEYNLRNQEFSIKLNFSTGKNIEQKLKILRVLLYAEKVFGVARIENIIKSEISKKMQASIEAGRCEGVEIEEVEKCEKLIVERLEKLAGRENALKIVEKIKQEVKE